MYFTIIPNVASFLLDDTVNSPGCHPRRAGREGDGKVMTTALRAHAEPRASSATMLIYQANWAMAAACHHFSCPLLFGGPTPHHAPRP
mmetsp:Transcript_45435/g.120878  ORF Transcript_45435/g.120878 Transcript_45435/m.120878 type:complete len:88 (+) Transcript_45435:246-509(+)